MIDLSFHAKILMFLEYWLSVTQVINQCQFKQYSYKLTRLYSNVDVDECAEDSQICGIGQCKNVKGSYECICQRGLKFDKDQKACVHIDDGTGGGGDGTDKNKCVTNLCGCPTGFYIYSPFFNPYGQTQCVDVNECNQGMCGAASCVNAIGTYRCTCPSGFQYQGGACNGMYSLNFQES